MTNDKSNLKSKGQKKYDLGERTAKFGENIIEFAKGIPITPITAPLITQLVKAGTSVGANYEEADGAVSKKDFMNKIGTCKKESKESRHWLRMIAKAVPSKRDGARILWQEAHELTLIFSTITKKK